MKYILIPKDGNGTSLTLENITNLRMLKVLERALENGTLVEWQGKLYYVDEEIDIK